MKSLFKKTKWIGIVLCSIAVALGITIMILALTGYGSVICDIVAIAAACVLFFIGTLSLIDSIFTETKKWFNESLLYGSLFIALGVVLLIARFQIKAGLLEQVFNYTFGIALICLGASLLFKAISLIVYRAKAWIIVLFFVVAAAAITLGILSLCYNVTTIIYVIAGLALICFGVLGIVLFALAKKQIKETKAVIVEEISKSEE